MRVSKTVREYIEKKVSEKVNAKYDAERIEAERQNNVMNDFWNNLSKELEALAAERVNKFLEENSFAEKGARDTITSFYPSAIMVADRHTNSSVHNWRNRARVEIKEKVEDILVTLELGRTKEDLERMINEI
jgi:predicted transcriptional regulator